MTLKHGSVRNSSSKDFTYEPFCDRTIQPFWLTTSIGQMLRPQNLRVTHGPQLSQLTARVQPVPGAVNYNWRITAKLPGVVPVIEQDTASKHMFKNLTGGVNYAIEPCVFGTAGLSDWTDPYSMFAD